MQPKILKETIPLTESFEDFFETALCGFVIADASGIILRANAKIAGWIHTSAEELRGKKISDLFSIGGKIYYETHLSPLLRMQGFFDEVVLELRSAAGEKLRVIVNGLERRDKDGEPAFIRYTILKASDRLKYEQNLQDAKNTAENELAKEREMVILREQLIAVLGHDLRNPLSAIKMAVELLSDSRDTNNEILLGTLQRSSARMMELVDNIMDFARTRMGEGIILASDNVMLEPVLQQVVAEMKLIYPSKEITTSFDIKEPVYCDAYRIAQLLSNLLANAITHGDTDSPVQVHAFHLNGYLELSVCNKGVPIPENLHERLFSPFTRKVNRSNQNGLGLGLFICSEIATAHKGTLRFTSDEEETCFTFRLTTTSV